MPDYKWKTMDPNAAAYLLQGTSSPGVVYPAPFSQAPAPMRDRMMGLKDFYVSHFITQQPLMNGVTVGGEMALVREQGDNRAYVYGFGTNALGQVCYLGPFTNFPSHHFDVTASGRQLFGHSPFSKKGT